MTDISEYHYTTADMAAKFRIAKKTVRKKAVTLGLGIRVGGRIGFRYSDEDMRRLTESMLLAPSKESNAA